MLDADGDMLFQLDGIQDDRVGSSGFLGQPGTYSSINTGLREMHSSCILRSSRQTVFLSVHLVVNVVLHCPESHVWGHMSASSLVPAQCKGL
jgi:hypothetical protein